MNLPTNSPSSASPSETTLGRAQKKMDAIVENFVRERFAGCPELAAWVSAPERRPALLSRHYGEVPGKWVFFPEMSKLGHHDWSLALNGALAFQALEERRTTLEAFLEKASPAALLAHVREDALDMEIPPEARTDPSKLRELLETFVLMNAENGPASGIVGPATKKLNAAVTRANGAIRSLKKIPEKAARLEKVREALRMVRQAVTAGPERYPEALGSIFQGSDGFETIASALDGEESAKKLVELECLGLVKGLLGVEIHLAEPAVPARKAQEPAAIPVPAAPRRASFVRPRVAGIVLGTLAATGVGGVTYWATRAPASQPTATPLARGSSGRPVSPETQELLSGLFVDARPAEAATGRVRAAERAIVVQLPGLLVSVMDELERPGGPGDSNGEWTRRCRAEILRRFQEMANQKGVSASDAKVLLDVSLGQGSIVATITIGGGVFATFSGRLPQPRRISMALDLLDRLPEARVSTADAFERRVGDLLERMGVGYSAMRLGENGYLVTCEIPGGRKLQKTVVLNH